MKDAACTIAKGVRESSSMSSMHDSFSMYGKSLPRSEIKRDAESAKVIDGNSMMFIFANFLPTWAKREVNKVEP